MKINGLHHQALAKHLQGRLKGDIATDLGLNRKTITRWFQDDDFLNELEKAYRRAYLYDAGEARRTTLTEMRKGDNSAARIRAARDILDRAGLKATEKHDITAEIDTYAHEDTEAVIAAGEAALAGLGRRRIPETPGD